MAEKITKEETIKESETSKGIGKAGTTVKEGIVGSLKGINEIEAEIVSLVRTLSNTLRPPAGCQ
jgi:hypothetical protein